jgi:hypothetical protein
MNVEMGLRLHNSFPGNICFFAVQYIEGHCQPLRLCEISPTLSEYTECHSPKINKMEFAASFLLVNNNRPLLIEQLLLNNYRR